MFIYVCYVYAYIYIIKYAPGGEPPREGPQQGVRREESSGSGMPFKSKLPRKSRRALVQRMYGS